MKGGVIIARTPSVTRTIDTNLVTVLCLDLAEKEPFEQEFRLPASYEKDSAILRIVAKLLPISKQPVQVRQIVKLGPQKYSFPEYLYLQYAAKQTDTENENN